MQELSNDEVKAVFGGQPFGALYFIDRSLRRPPFGDPSTGDCDNLVFADTDEIPPECF